MGIKVYYSEISAHKEVKKRQQKVMMILESKHIPYESIDITEAGRESDKDFMLANAKPKEGSKYVLSPQVFNEDSYCGDYDDFELANENDELEKFLNIAKRESSGFMVQNGNQNGAAPTAINGTSRENSAEKQTTEEKVVEAPSPIVTYDLPTADPEPAQNVVPLEEFEESHPEEEEEPMSTSEQKPVPPPHEEELLDNVQQPEEEEEQEYEEEPED